jgi:hypothetical protein
MSEEESQMLPLVVSVALVVGIWLLIKWLTGGRVKPEPWGMDVEARLQNEELPPTCPHCSATYSEADYFCPGCGESAGQYNNYSPYLYIFTLGDLLRRGTSERFQANWVTITGYLLLSFCYYTVFAPIYWVMLFINLRRQGQEAAAPPPAVA